MHKYTFIFLSLQFCTILKWKSAKCIAVYCFHHEKRKQQQINCVQSECMNKKVLLRERKRHTARRVSSTPLLFLPGEIFPSRTWMGGPDGVLLHQPEWGIPCWPDGGIPARNVNRQTPVKTVPSPFLRNAGGNNDDKNICWAILCVIRWHLGYCHK